MEKELPYFYNIHCIKAPLTLCNAVTLCQPRVIIFSFFSAVFLLLLMQQNSSFILLTVLFRKNTALTLLDFFNRVPFLFLVYANMYFKHL